MTARSDRRKTSLSQPPAGGSSAERSAIARGFRASSESRGRTERALGIAAGAAVVAYFAAAVVRRWGADVDPQPLELNRDRRGRRLDD